MTPLIASASKGRNQYYHYYHCTAACRLRFKAKEVNVSFLKKLFEFKPKPGLIEVYKIIFEEVSNSFNGSGFSGRKKIQDKIENLNSKLTVARDLFINGDLTSEDYKDAKSDLSEQVLTLETQLTRIEPNSDKELINNFTKAVSIAEKLDFLFSKEYLGQIRIIIGLTLPENITFVGVENRINNVDNSIYLGKSEIGGKKNGQSHLKWL